MERKLCSCKRAYESPLSGICELCWDEAYPSKMSETDKDLAYWRKNAEEEPKTNLEKHLESLPDSQFIRRSAVVPQQETLEEADSYENGFGQDASGTESVDFIEGANLV